MSHAHSTPIRRALGATAKVLSATERRCSFVASNQTIDCYREIVRAAGWQFDRFQLNAPFVDSHNYDSVGFLLGQVTGWRVQGNDLVEDVQFIPEGESGLADFAWKMVAAGFLKAVSVGFIPDDIRAPYRDLKAWEQACAALNLSAEQIAKTSCIHWSQDQTELSLVLIGANPTAVAKAHAAGAVSDGDLARLGFRDDDLQFLHEAAAGYEAAPAPLRKQIREELRNCFTKVSASPTDTSKPEGKEAQRAAALGKEKRAAGVQSLLAALRSLGAGNPKP